MFAFSSLKTQHKTVTYDKQTLKRRKYFSTKVMNMKLSNSEYLSDRKKTH